MNLPTSLFEKMMKQKPRPRPPARPKPPRGSPLPPGCPYWRGLGCVCCYQELSERPGWREVRPCPAN